MTRDHRPVTCPACRGLLRLAVDPDDRLVVACDCPGRPRTLRDAVAGVASGELAAEPDDEDDELIGAGT